MLPYCERWFLSENIILKHYVGGSVFWGVVGKDKVTGGYYSRQRGRAKII